MSETNGLSATEIKQPQTDAEASAIFEEIYKASLKNETVNDRQLDKVAKEVREHIAETSPAVSENTEVTETTTEEVTAEVTETTTTESAEQPTNTEVVIKPEDYQAVLAEKAKWEQKARSLDGREAARQRQIQELENKIKQLSQAPAPQTQKDQKQAPAKDPRWDALKQADPELADLLLDFKNEIRQEALREAEQIINQRVEPIYQQQSASYAEREQQRLVEMIPNALEILEHPAYAEWYYRQPDYIQKKANENAESAAAILQMYGYEMSLRYPQQQQDQKPAQQETSAPNPKVAKLQEEREKRVQVGSVGQKQSAPAKTDTLNPDEYFKKVFNETIKKR